MEHQTAAQSFMISFDAGPLKNWSFIFFFSNRIPNDVVNIF